MDRGSACTVDVDTGLGAVLSCDQNRAWEIGSGVQRTNRCPIVIAHGPGLDDSHWWAADPMTLLGSALIGGPVVAFVVLALRPSRQGRIWPRARTASFVLGSVLLGLTLYAPLNRFDDGQAVHASQHLVLMMVIPPLLVLGGPLRLMLRSMSRKSRRAVLDTLGDPAMHAVLAGRRAAFWLCFDYYLSMAVYLLTPLYKWSTVHEWLHIASHIYFLLCGLVFWVAIIGEDPLGMRLSWPQKRLMLGLGIPFYLALGVAVMTIPPHFGLPGSPGAGTVLIIGGSVISALSVAAVWWRHSRRSRSRPDSVTTGGLPWRAVF